MKENILIVGDFNRSDFLYVAKILKDQFRIFFIEYTHKSEVTSTEYQNYGEAIFWSDFRSAGQLISYVKPKKVFFYFIETYNHVALNLACKVSGVKTFHIEHGIRSHEFLKADLFIPAPTFSERVRQVIEKVKTIDKRLRGRQFFKGTRKELPEKYAQFLERYFEIRKKESIARTFELIRSDLRLADKYISFSPKIFEFHVKNDHLASDYPVEFIGCPAFDYLADVTLKEPNEKNILFIDNAFEAQALFGWNEQNKRDFLKKLIDFSESTGHRLYIKMHPYSKQALYSEAVENRNAELIDNDDLIKVMEKTRHIIGFYSTLLMPLMAMKHTTCFSLEMHPAPLASSLSRFLTKSGASSEIGSWDALYTAFQNLDAIYSSQLLSKETFVEEWLYKFDGKSTNRFLQAIKN